MAATLGLEGRLAGPRRDFRSLVILAAGLLAALITLLTAFGSADLSFLGARLSPTPEPDVPLLRAVFFDVGQGDSILVTAPGGGAMLVDAGSDPSDVGNVILPRLDGFGIRHLEYLVLSHPHQDHVGGMPAIMDGVDVGNVVLAGQVHPNQAYEAFLSMIKDADIPVLKARAGKSFSLGAEVDVQILWPEDPLFEDTEDAVNENSVVLRVSYGDVALLLTGDIEEDAQKVLLVRDAQLHSQILKVPHHGSYCDIQGEWLAAVGPEVAIISVGADNPYDQPHGETLTHLELQGVSVYRTDLRGTITVTTDGLNYTVSTER